MIKSISIIVAVFILTATAAMAQQKLTPGQEVVGMRIKAIRMQGESQAIESAIEHFKERRVVLISNYNKLATEIKNATAEIAKQKAESEAAVQAVTDSEKGAGPGKGE